MTPASPPAASSARVVALLFDPFALWCARRDPPAGRPDASREDPAPSAERPLALARAERIVAVDVAAKRAGVRPGMSVAAARLRADLALVEEDPPAEQAAWEALLDELHAVTPWLEPLARGRALLRCSPAEGAELAAQHGARAGAAPSREAALLAALAARPGRLREAPDPAALLARLPLRFLRGVGLSEEGERRLQWLGLERAGELARWRADQRRAFLGAEADGLEPYLAPGGRRDVARFVPPPAVRARLRFDEPALEPWQWEPALTHLAEVAAARLEGRVAGRLLLRAEVGGLAFRAARLPKEGLRTAGPVLRLARRALDDSGAPALGIEGLELELGALARPARQDDLFGRRAAREEAVRRVQARFPNALARVVELDPDALAPEHRYVLREWEPARGSGEGDAGHGAGHAARAAEATR